MLSPPMGTSVPHNGAAPEPGVRLPSPARPPSVVPTDDTCPPCLPPAPASADGQPVPRGRPRTLARMRLRPSFDRATPSKQQEAGHAPALLHPASAPYDFLNDPPEVKKKSFFTARRPSQLTLRLREASPSSFAYSGPASRRTGSLSVLLAPDVPPPSPLSVRERPSTSDPSAASPPRTVAEPTFGSLPLPATAPMQTLSSSSNHPASSPPELAHLPSFPSGSSLPMAVSPTNKQYPVAAMSTEAGNAAPAASASMDDRTTLASTAPASGVARGDSVSSASMGAPTAESSATDTPHPTPPLDFDEYLKNTDWTKIISPTGESFVSSGPLRSNADQGPVPHTSSSAKDALGETLLLSPLLGIRSASRARSRRRKGHARPSFSDAQDGDPLSAVPSAPTMFPSGSSMSSLDSLAQLANAFRDPRTIGKKRSIGGPPPSAQSAVDSAGTGTDPSTGFMPELADVGPAGPSDDMLFSLDMSRPVSQAGSTVSVGGSSIVAGYSLASVTDGLKAYASPDVAAGGFSNHPPPSPLYFAPSGDRTRGLYHGLSMPDLGLSQSADPTDEMSVFPRRPSAGTQRISLKGRNLLRHLRTKSTEGSQNKTKSPIGLPLQSPRVQTFPVASGVPEVDEEPHDDRNSQPASMPRTSQERPPSSPLSPQTVSTPGRILHPLTPPSDLIALLAAPPDNYLDLTPTSPAETLWAALQTTRAAAILLQHRSSLPGTASSQSLGGASQSPFSSSFSFPTKGSVTSPSSIEQMLDALYLSLAPSNGTSSAYRPSEEREEPSLLSSTRPQRGATRTSEPTGLAMGAAYRQPERTPSRLSGQRGGGARHRAYSAGARPGMGVVYKPAQPEPSLDADGPSSSCRRESSPCPRSPPTPSTAWSASYLSPSLTAALSPPTPNSAWPPGGSFAPLTGPDTVLALSPESNSASETRGLARVNGSSYPTDPEETKVTLALTQPLSRVLDGGKEAFGRHPTFPSVSGVEGPGPASTTGAAAYLALARSRITEQDAELYARFLQRSEERLGQAAESSA